MVKFVTNDLLLVAWGSNGSFSSYRLERDRGERRLTLLDTFHPAFGGAVVDLALGPEFQNGVRGFAAGGCSPKVLFGAIDTRTGRILRLDLPARSLEDALGEAGPIKAVCSLTWTSSTFVATTHAGSVLAFDFAMRDGGFTLTPRYCANTGRSPLYAHCDLGKDQFLLGHGDGEFALLTVDNRGGKWHSTYAIGEAPNMGDIGTIECRNGMVMMDGEDAVTFWRLKPDHTLGLIGSEPHRKSWGPDRAFVNATWSNINTPTKPRLFLTGSQGYLTEVALPTPPREDPHSTMVLDVTRTTTLTNTTISSSQPAPVCNRESKHIRTLLFEASQPADGGRTQLEEKENLAPMAVEQPVEDLDRFADAFLADEL